jgi:hypothetical protein
MDRLTTRDVAFVLAVEPGTVDLMVRDGHLEDPGSIGWSVQMVQDFTKRDDPSRWRPASRLWRLWWKRRSGGSTCGSSGWASAQAPAPPLPR